MDHSRCIIKTPNSPSIQSNQAFQCVFKPPNNHSILQQDGTERSIESISLIDAVLPEVIEQKKQGASKGQTQIKTELAGADDSEYTSV